MILIDANLLLYAYDLTSEQHERAKTWLEATLNEGQPVRLAWATILAFLRIGTNPRALAVPLSIREATRIVAEWLALPNVASLEPGERHFEILVRLLESAQARGPLVMDAHLAALAIEHGATLCTTDRDFTRFGQLRVSNPLA